MPPKRAKSGTGSASVQRWEQALVSAAFSEEDKWWGSVSLLLGNQVEDNAHLDVIVSAINSGCRKLFSVIAKEELFNTVRELGNPKAKKPKEIPANYEICEPCKTYLDANEDIPLPLLAKLIKFKLLDIRSRDQKRRETDKKGPEAKDKGAKGGKDKKQDRSKSPAKGKGGKKTPEPPSAKGDSKLKKRGEEDEDGKYINDEPDDGPHHYVILTGFNQPHLFSQLAEIGVNIDCIIKVTSEDYSRFVVVNEHDMEGEAPEKDDKTLALEEEARQAAAKERKALRLFWKDSLPLLRSAPEGSALHDIARFEYLVKNEIIPEDAEDAEKKAQFGVNMFEDLACMIYDMFDAKRQWKNYMVNLKLVHVPLQVFPPEQSKTQEAVSMPSMTPAAGKEKEKAAPPADLVSQVESDTKSKAGHEVDLRYYNDLLNIVPQESISVPLIMHCMLEQIVACEEDKEPPSETPRPPRSDGLEESISKHISCLAFKLALSDEEQQILAGEFEPPEKSEPVPKQPVLINYNDDVTRRLNHLKPLDGFDPRQAELEMLGYMPTCRLSDFPQPPAKLAKERAARLQELLQFVATGGLTQSEIDHSFKQFVLECVELTETDEEGFLDETAKRSKQLNIPWDDPYPYFVGLIPPESVDEDNEELMEINKMSEHEPDRSPSAEGRTEPADTLIPAQSESVLSGPIEEGEISASRSSTRNRQRSRKSQRSSARSPNAKGTTPPATPPPAAATPPPEEGVRPVSPGILKNSRAGSATSRKSASSSLSGDDDHSVHWEKSEEGQLLPQPGDPEAMEQTDLAVPAQPMAAPGDAMEMVNDVQKRVLDQWCFAEHMEPDVLKQTIVKALYTHPNVDTYYHKRDHSLMVVLHNPHHQQLLQNHTTWHTELHSNVGFRNYLEHVASDPDVEEWLRAEEAKYQASILAKEVEVITKEAEEAASRPTSAKDKKKERSKSPKKTSSRTGKSPSRSSSTERPSSGNPFVRQGSLKAWKDEQDKARAEEEEKEKQKQEKRARSASKKASKEQMEKEEKEKEKKRPGSRNSSKSRQSKEEVSVPSQEQGDETKQPDKFWPLQGYDVGNDLLHAVGTVKTMFPADGGLIRMEQVQFIQGTNSVKTSVVKDGHTFTVHVLDPKVEGEEDEEEEEEKVAPTPGEDEKKEVEMEKGEMEKSEKEELGSQIGTPREMTPQPQIPLKPAVGCFGSFSAQFADGLSLAISTYGHEGEPVNGKPYMPAPYTPPQPRSPSPTAKESPAKGKKGKDKSEKSQATPEPSTVEEPVEEEKEEERTYPEQPFQAMYVTAPDGLAINYYLESSIGIPPENDDERHLLVRQSYPFKTHGTQKCEAARKCAMEEQSRVINSDGTIVKTLQDGTVEVLQADGTCSVFCQSSPFIVPSRSSSKERPASAQSERESPSRKGLKKQKSAKKSIETASEAPVEEEVELGFWITTLPSGERVGTKMDHSKVAVRNAQVCVASDPQTGQTMHTREDHVVTVYHPDGTMVVEHSDGTRITTFYRELQVATSAPDAAETGEPPEMDTKKTKFVCVECPGYATVKFDSHTQECRTEFGNGAVIHAMVNGSYDLYASDGSYLQIEEDGGATYFPKPNNDVEMMNPSQQLQYVMRHFADTIVETVDNAGNIFSVKNSGETVVNLAEGMEMAAQDEEETVQEGALVKSENLLYYKQHAPRFFILHNDGSGTELLRYQDVAEYVANAEDDPGTAILMDPLPDYPGVVGITVLKPYTRDVSQRWLKGYEQETIIPPGLTSRDLKTLPPSEEAKGGPRFGTNVGQGLSIGSVVKNQMKPPILKCPSVLEVRQILQYKPIMKELRETLGQGLRQYAEYVKARQASTQALQVDDPRSEEEKILAADLQALASTEAGRSTSLEGGDVKCLYEKATAPPIPSPPPTPQPKRTKADWERDLRELAEEKDNRKALKNHEVPPYFESELGKAFLLTQAPDMEALTRQLADDRRTGSERAVRSTTPSNGQRRRSSNSNNNQDMTASNVSTVTGTTTISPQAHTNVDSSPSPLTGVVAETPSGLRPGNPTPGHATGQGSPAPLRPGNPTPSHATKVVPDRPGAPTPKEASNNMAVNSESPSSHAYPSIQEQPLEESYDEGCIPSATSDLVNTRSLAVDVVGRPRREPVRVPAYINGARPGALPNRKFAEIEDPVRRKVYTSSVVGATPKGCTTLKSMRGFEILPDRCDFGVLREGSTYAIKIHLKNTGVDACRFRVKQPPPSTGLKVNYKPGPVAAGMKSEFDVEIYAIAVGVMGGQGVGLISHNLEITTETDKLYVPITATVLTANQYDNRGADCPRGGKAPGVKHVSNKPPAGQGIIRPRKDEIIST